MPSGSLLREVAELIVSGLNLETAPEEIEPESPLFYEGLGLDSIDALELSLEIKQRYGYEIRSDDPDVTTIFSSLGALATAIEKNRAK